MNLLFMSLVRLLVHSRLLVESGGNQRYYVDFQLHEGSWLLTAVLFKDWLY